MEFPNNRKRKRPVPQNMQIDKTVLDRTLEGLRWKKDLLSQQDQHYRQFKRRRPLQAQRKRNEYIKKHFSPFPIEENRHIPNFSIIPKTCLGGQLHSSDTALLYEVDLRHNKYKSDHALIRVEFHDFVIYSWNLLNGDDTTVISDTFGNLNYPNEFPLPVDEKREYKHLHERTKNNIAKFAVDFKNTNRERTENLLYIVDRVKQSEVKPVILFFQEGGPTMLTVIHEKKHYQEDYYIFNDYNEKELAWEPGSKQAVLKNEFCVTLIPKMIAKENIVQHSISMWHNEPQKLIYKKPQLLISFVINRKEFCLINCHWYSLSLFKDVKNFIDQVDTYLEERGIKNVIYVGDFNRPLFSSKEDDLGFKSRITEIQEKLEKIKLHSQQQQINYIQQNETDEENKFAFLQDRIVKYLTKKQYHILNQEEKTTKKLQADMQKSALNRSKSLLHPYPGIPPQAVKSSSKTEQYTFITDSHGSDYVDQCIYRVEEPVSEGKFTLFEPVNNENDYYPNKNFSYVGGQKQIEQSYKKYLPKYNRLLSPQNMKLQNTQQQNTQQQGKMKLQNMKGQGITNQI